MLHANGRGDMWWTTSDVDLMKDAYTQLVAVILAQQVCGIVQDKALLQQLPQVHHVLCVVCCILLLCVISSVSVTLYHCVVCCFKI